MDQLAFFRLFHPISIADYKLITEGFRSRLFKKGDLIISPGQTQKEIYFVDKGVQMSYFEAEKKIHVIAFTYPPNPCAIPESFCFQQPSKYYLKCLTDSEVRFLAFDQLQVLFDKSQA